ncbi:MAG: PilW family protein [Desulfotomaculales bacterium]
MRGRVGERGFTLVEVVVALLIFSLVVGAALAVYQQAMLSWHREEARVDVQENLRIGLDRMSRELRAAVALYEANNNSVRFKSADGKTVQYYHRADLEQLMREVDGGHNPVASYVTALRLAYYGADYNPTQNTGTIRLVRITLTGRKGNGPEVTMTTSVRIRTLG